MLTADYRALISALLPPGAFLRRDRGCALFITNAPARTGNVDALRRQIAISGFDTVLDGMLLRIVPSPSLLQNLESTAAPDFFALTARRWQGVPPTPESIEIFALCLKSMETGQDFDEFDKRLRKAVSEALRTGNGGGLYACALLRAQWISFGKI